MELGLVGGGLAGLSAALEAFESGASVTVLEGEAQLGGNSAKATSGMNAAESATQKQLNIQDGVQGFVEDTLKSGDGLSRPELVQQLAAKSADAVSWLHSLAALNGSPLRLNDVIQLGGHSVPRTHRFSPLADGKPIPVGLNIVKLVRDRLENVSKTEPERMMIMTGCKVSGLESDIVRGGETRVTGVRYERAGVESVLRADAVVLATGGYSNDHTDTSLLHEFAPDKASLPTTNGPFAQGWGVKLARRLGAYVIHMDKVQVHPTGFVDPADPKARTKFLAPEALRGSGGVLLNERGQRFVDELDRRDHVTAAIEQHCAASDAVGGHVAYMVLSDPMVDRFGRGAFGFYHLVKKFFERFDDAVAMAQRLQMDSQLLAAALAEHNAARADARSDAFGKRTFPFALLPDLPLYAARVTPSIHYTMGGLLIDTEARVQDLRFQSIVGLYAAGEVSGGVHGENRLGGNSLLECVAYGRIAGARAAALTH